MAQRQHLQKQKEAQLLASSLNTDSKPVIQLPAGAQIKPASAHATLPANIKTSITTNTLIPATIIEKKSELGHDVANWAAVPPLAPLSSGSNTRQTSIVPTSIPIKMDEDSNMSGTSSIFGTNPATPSGDDPEGAFAGFEGMLIPGRQEDDSKDGLGRPSQVVSSNKMLADLLIKKSTDPPFIIGSTEVTTTTKRKRDASIDGDPTAKRAVADAKSDSQKASATSATNLYAELFASVTEDEYLEEEVTTVAPSPAVADPQKSVITMPIQRQIIMSPNQPPQMILAAQANQQIGHATTTIKTEAGYQTVPVIIQQGGSNPVANIQLQKQIGGMGQQIMQPVMQQQQTQYVLATNQQGQTYLVAQQPSPQQTVNQILVTQTQQQGGGPPTKTIIILQQQAGPGGPQQTIQQAPPGHQIIGHVNTPGQPQKVIMTNQQGQQMIVTQVPRPVQHQIIVNQHPISSSTVVQANPSITTTNAMINQVGGAQSHIVSQVQLQQPQSQLSLPGQIQHQTIQIQKQSIHPNYITQHTVGGQQLSIHQQSQPVGQQQIVVQQHNQQTVHIQQQQQTVIQQTPQPSQHGKVAATRAQATIQVPSSPVIERRTESPMEKKVFVTGSGNIEMTEIKQSPTPVVSTTATPKVEEDGWDPNYMWVCDWRGCQG